MISTYPIRFTGVAGFISSVHLFIEKLLIMSDIFSFGCDQDMPYFAVDRPFYGNWKSLAYRPAFAAHDQSDS